MGLHMNEESESRSGLWKLVAVTAAAAVVGAVVIVPAALWWM